MKKPISQKGAVSIILAVLLLSMLLAIGLGISALMFQQVKLSGQIGHSVVAFYAGEAGAEKCLYQIRCVVAPPEYHTPECIAATAPAGECDDEIGGVTTGNLDLAGASYQASRDADVALTSIGQFGITNREVELDWSP